MNDSIHAFYKDFIRNSTNKQDKFLKFFYSSRSHVAVILHFAIFDSKPQASFENICNTIPRSLCSRSTIKKILDEGVDRYFFEKKKDKINSQKPHAIIIGLDKITAKSKRIKINFNETKIFGQLEIKILKCGKVKTHNKMDDVAYMQVKDKSKSENEKVFIFNGWTFSSDPSLSPFDHAIYDLQLVNCYNV